MLLCLINVFEVIVLIFVAYSIQIIQGSLIYEVSKLRFFSGHWWSELQLRLLWPLKRVDLLVHGLSLVGGLRLSRVLASNRSVSLIRVRPEPSSILLIEGLLLVGCQVIVIPLSEGLEFVFFRIYA